MERMTIESLKEIHETASNVPVVSDDRPFRHTALAAGVRPASDKSIAFLRKLVAERLPDTDESYTQDIIDQGQNRVSRAIDKLLAMPKVVTDEAPRTFEPRVNRYAARCVECRAEVEAEAGILSLNDEGRWEVIHRPGECHMTEFPFPYGRYAVEGEDGALKFYRVTEHGLYVQASDELHDLPTTAVPGIVAKIAADPQAASMAYGRELGHCGRCGRTLTDSDSRERGIGPVCSSRSWD